MTLIEGYSIFLKTVGNFNRTTEFAETQHLLLSNQITPKLASKRQIMDEFETKLSDFAASNVLFFCHQFNTSCKSIEQFFRKINSSKRTHMDRIVILSLYKDKPFVLTIDKFPKTIQLVGRLHFSEVLSIQTIVSEGFTNRVDLGWQDSNDFVWEVVEEDGPKDTIFFKYMILAMNACFYCEKVIDADVLDGFVGAIAYIFVLQNRLMQYPQTAVANERLGVLTQVIPSVVMRRREPGFTLSINKSL